MARSSDTTKSPEEAWTERHYSVGELAEMWNLDPATIRGWFVDEPGVLKHGQAGIRNRKRPYITLRIPESVARRVHAARSRGWAETETAGERKTRRRPPGSDGIKSSDELEHLCSAV